MYVFHISGNTQVFNNYSNIIFRDIVIDSLQILTILIDKLSQPCALVGSSGFIVRNILFSVVWKQFILLFVLQVKSGRV